MDVNLTGTRAQPFLVGRVPEQLFDLYLIGYDGIHPTDTGYAFIANEWVAFLNQQYGTQFQPVELAPIVFGTAPVVTSLSGTSGAAGASGRDPWLGAPSPAFEFTQEAFDQLRSVFPALSTP